MSMRAWQKGSLSIVLALLAWGPTLAQSPVSALPGALPPPPRPQLASPPPPAGITSESPCEGGDAEADSDEWGGLPKGLFLEADYLFLRPLVQPRDYAIVDPGGSNAPLGSIQQLALPWRSGLRVGAGYTLASGWEASFFYTYLHSAAGDAISAPAGGLLLATLTQPGTVEQVQTAVAATSLNYNVFDLEIGKRFQPCDTLALRAFGGTRFANIGNDFGVTYNGIDANQDQVFNHLTFHGAGLMLGGEGYKNLWQGLGLFGRASGSLLAGDYSTQFFEGNNGGTTALANVTDHFEKVVPVVELTLGASYQYRNLYLSVGYQFINWFGLIDLPNFSDDYAQGHLVRNTGDLSLNGLTARMAWNF
jgi:hypothetical protein